MSTPPLPERRFGPLALDELTDEQLAVAEAIMGGPRGRASRLRGPFEAMLQSPGFAAAAEQLGVQVRFETSIPAALNEMAICMVARHYCAQYGWWAHRRLASEAGLPESVLGKIAAATRPELGPDASAVYEFVLGLLHDGDVSDGTFRAVVERWGKRGAIDLIGTVGYYTLVSYILNVDHYPIPSGSEPLTPLIDKC